MGFPPTPCAIHPLSKTTPPCYPTPNKTFYPQNPQIHPENFLKTIQFPNPTPLRRKTTPISMKTSPIVSKNNSPLRHKPSETIRNNYAQLPNCFKTIPHHPNPPRRRTMTTVGSGKYTYQLIEDWAKFPDGVGFGWPASVATDSNDRVYVFQREEQPPVLVFDPDGAYLTGWGIDAMAGPHHIYIADDIAYLVDREDCVVPTLHPRRQAPPGNRRPRPRLRHRHRPRLRQRKRPAASRRRPLQLPHQVRPVPQRRRLRLRRLPKQPRPPLLRRRQAQKLLGAARKDRPLRPPPPPTASSSPKMAKSTSATAKITASRFTTPKAPTSLLGTTSAALWTSP